jgi:hypothetical protein
MHPTTSITSLSVGSGLQCNEKLWHRTFAGLQIGLGHAIATRNKIKLHYPKIIRPPGRGQTTSGKLDEYVEVNIYTGNTE